MVLSSFPSEIVLHILSYLPVSSLAQLPLVSRAWNAFLLQYQTTIYRHTAFLHGFIDDDSAPFLPAEIRKRYAAKVFDNLNSWKDLCERRISIRNAWNGVAPSRTITKPARGLLERVHRIKVDEKRRLIMNTTGLDIPEVLVRDLETATISWSLQPSMGRIYAHLEYSEGFLIFDRRNGDREVWRLDDSRERDPILAVPCAEIPPDFDPNSKPDAAMYEDSQMALLLARESEGVGHRHMARFEPYALLHSPEETRAYRFVYPTLLTAARDKAYLWDVPSARVVEVVHGIQHARFPEISRRDPCVENTMEADAESSGGGAGDESLVDEQEHGYNEELGVEDNDEAGEWGTSPLYRVPRDVFLLRSLIYVDHSPSHIFLAGKYVLKIFNCLPNTAGETEDGQGTSLRQSSSNQLALAITSTKMHYGRWKYSIKPGSGKHERNSSLVRYEFGVSEISREENVLLFDRFKAVHVSPCGSHFVALLNGARLLIVPHFRKLVGQPDDVVHNHILDVQLGSPQSGSVYLAYEEGDGVGRVGVVTTSAVFIVTLPPFSPNYPTNEAPFLRVSRLKQFMNTDWLKSVTCLVLSDTHLFLNYDTTWDGNSLVSAVRLRVWENGFEDSLEDLQTNGYECYERGQGAFFVRELIDHFDLRHESAIFDVDMLPNT